MMRRMVAHFFLLWGTSNQKILTLLPELLRIDMLPWMLAMYGYYGIMHDATYG